MDNSLRSHDSSMKHTFLKIIVSQISSESKVVIPKKFLRKYGEDLHNRVLLKAPGGEAWPVDLERDECKTWLRNGWPEFARFYSICFGHVLLFEYHGNCNFHVVIFDKSATEIDYPLTDCLEEQFNFKFKKSVKRASEIDDLRACKKTRANSGCKETCHFGECLMRKSQPENIARNSPKMKSLDTDKEAADHADIEKPNIVVVNEASCIQHHKIKTIKIEGDLINQMQHPITGGSAIEVGKARALALAKAFKSNNPSFILPVHPSHVDNRLRGVHVKKSFKETYETWDDIDMVILQVSERTWPVECCLRSTGYRLTFGWKEFASDNSLSVGDVCVFELINHSTKLLNVTIFRAAVENQNASN